MLITVEDLTHLPALESPATIWELHLKLRSKQLAIVFFQIYSTPQNTVHHVKLVYHKQSLEFIAQRHAVSRVFCRQLHTAAEDVIYIFAVLVCSAHERLAARMRYVNYSL